MIQVRILDENRDIINVSKLPQSLFVIYHPKTPTVRDIKQLKELSNILPKPYTLQIKMGRMYHDYDNGKGKKRVTTSVTQKSHSPKELQMPPWIAQSHRKRPDASIKRKQDEIIATVEDMIKKIDQVKNGRYAWILFNSTEIALGRMLPERLVHNKGNKVYEKVTSGYVLSNELTGPVGGHHWPSQRQQVDANEYIELINMSKTQLNSELFRLQKASLNQLYQADETGTLPKQQRATLVLRIRTILMIMIHKGWFDSIVTKFNGYY